MASITVRRLDEKTQARLRVRAAQHGRSMEAEILRGLMLLPAGRRRRALEAAATSMFTEDSGGRILGFDTDAAPPYARNASERRRAGRPVSHFDAQIAAIARSTGAAIATRNLRDFDGCGVTLVDPWNP